MRGLTGFLTKMEMTSIWQIMKNSEKSAKNVKMAESTDRDK